ncbi:MAG: RnfABCDGE type electron transport complex subunit B [Deltaproteobacteria bacterium]|nr:RnfABCDGE type electron transport complex subunit B [Deltaproteobacteria bacterium]
MTPLLVPVAVLSGIGIVMAALLAVGRKAFAVEVDERQEKLMDILPGANCGGCGYAGCSGYAAALVKGEAKPTLCPPGGADLAGEIGVIMGVEVEDMPDMVALVACAGDDKLAPERSSYLGVQTCAAAHAVAGGMKKCTHGCLGLGSCVEACPFGAIVITDHNLAVVVPELCTGCAQCVATCPRNIIKLVPGSEKVHVLCHNPDKAKATKAVCSVGCTGCKLCAKQSKRFMIDGALAAVDPEGKGEIPADAPLVCATGSIYDGRLYTMTAWTTDAAAREERDKKSEEWKESEKARKAALKAAKKAAKEKKAKEKAESDGGQEGGSA